MAKRERLAIGLLACSLALAACAQPPQTVVGPATAAILVIDDFSLLSTTQMTDKPEVPAKTQNCILHWNGQQYGSSGVAVGDTGAPHGVVVYAELSDLLEKASGPSATPVATIASPPAAAPAWLRGVEHWHLPDGDILLVGVDTGGFTTDRVRQNISGAIDFFRSSQRTAALSLPSVAGLVLNMSFAVVPCDPDIPLDSYVAMVDNDPKLNRLRDQLTHLGYRKDLASWLVAGNPAGVYPPGPEALPERAWLKQDPLLTLLVDQGSSVIPVAAAGNSPGVEYPYAPALWPGIVSVSACYAPPCLEFTGETNSGEIVEYGVYAYTAPGSAEVNEVNGTSFAAPRVSVLEAIYLLQTATSACPPPGATPLSKPALDYADYLNPGWDNLPVLDAAAKYCPPFPSP